MLCLIGKDDAIFPPSYVNHHRVKTVVKEALERAIVRVLTPKRSTDVLREIMLAKSKGRSVSQSINRKDDAAILPSLSSMQVSMSSSI